MSQDFHPKQFVFASSLVFIVAMFAVYFVFWNSVALEARANKPASVSFTTELFKVDSDRIIMTGNIHAGASSELRRLIYENPDVGEIIMLDVDGTDLDTALDAAGVVSAQGLITHVPTNGRIYNYALEFFLAGKERIVEDGGLVGFVNTGVKTINYEYTNDLIEGYYNALGIGQDFIKFRNDKSANQEYWLTEGEIDRYDFNTGVKISDYFEVIEKR